MYALDRTFVFAGWIDIYCCKSHRLLCQVMIKQLRRDRKCFGELLKSGDEREVDKDKAENGD